MLVHFKKLHKVFVNIALTKANSYTCKCNSKKKQFLHPTNISSSAIGDNSGDASF